MKADLHLHSTASDGILKPEEVVKMAASLGFTHMALTDHDSTEGLEAAGRAAKALGMTLIPGVELSCGGQKEIHVLGYGFDPENQAMREFCRMRTADREERAQKMVENLRREGKMITIERVHELARGVVARPHVARALLEAGYATSMSDAFDRFLVPGRCGYVPKRDVKVSEAVKLIGEAGGVAVLAHPMELKMGDMAIESLVREWKGEGLAGVEVYHPSAANHHLPFLDRLARREGLLVTGGSDFHGDMAHGSVLGDGLNRWTTMEQDLMTFMKRIQRVV